LITIGCGEASPEESLANEIPNRHINFTILLDLSDRVLNPDQVDRDKILVKKIYELFEMEVRLDVYINSLDKISVHAAPQSSATYSTIQYEDSMFIDMSRMGIAEKKGGEIRRKNAFFNSLDALYALAIADSSRGYSGADIWKWFKNDLAIDSTRQNFVFVLTDGYMNVQDRQEANIDTLTSIGRSLAGANVLVMEFSPNDDDYSYERVHNVWGRWFASMGIKNYRVLKTSALQATNQQLTDFVSNPAPDKNIVFTETASFDERTTGVNRQPGDMGYIMVADDRIHREKEYAWRVAGSNAEFSTYDKPHDIVGQELRILYKMNLRQELPPDNAEYYTTVGINKILFREDWVECLSEPIGIARSRSTQYWVKVRFKRGVDMTAKAIARTSNPTSNTANSAAPKVAETTTTVSSPNARDGANGGSNLYLSIVSSPDYLKPERCGAMNSRVTLKVSDPSGAPVSNCTITVGIKSAKWLRSPNLIEKPPGTWSVVTGLNGTATLDVKQPGDLDSGLLHLRFAVPNSQPVTFAETAIPLCKACEACN